MGGEESNELSSQKDLCKIFKNAGLTGAGDIFFKFINYIIVWLVVRIIGAAHYGVYLLAWAIVSFSAILSSAGLQTGLIKFTSQYHGVGDKARIKGTILFSLQVVCILSVLLVLLLIPGAGLLEVWVFKKAYFASTLRWLSLSLPFITFTSLFLGAIQGFQVIKYRVYVEKFWQPLSFLFFLIILFGVQGGTLKELVWAKIGSIFIECLSAAYFLHRLFPLYRDNSPAIYEKRQIVAFSSPLILSGFLTYFIMYVDILMLGYFKSSAEVGIYAVLVRIVQIVILPLTSFEIIFSPMVADLFNRNEFLRLEELHKLTTKWICLFALPIFCLTALFSRPLLQLFGNEFIIAQIPLIILAIGQLSRVLVGISGQLVLMTGHPRLVLLNNLILFAVNALLNYALIPGYGMFGAAVATSCSYIMVNNLEMIEILRILRIHPYSLHFFKPLLAGLLSSAIAFLFSGYSAMSSWADGVWMILGASSFFIAYAVLLKIFGFSSEDRFIIAKIKKFFPGRLAGLDFSSR